VSLPVPGRPLIAAAASDEAKDLERDYAITGKRSIGTLPRRLRPLRRHFALLRAVDITTNRVRTCVTARQDDGVANATINRELAALKRMFTLALQGERLSHRPCIPMLEEDNARQGFLDHGGFLALRDGLPDYPKDPVTFLYLSPWRVSEMRGLEWRDVDLAGHVVRLRPELSKNKDGRVLPLNDELLAVIERAIRRDGSTAPRSSMTTDTRVVISARRGGRRVPPLGSPAACA